MSSQSKRRPRKQVEKVYKIMKPEGLEQSRSPIARSSESFITLPIIKRIKESTTINNELKEELIQEFIQEHNQIGDILMAYGQEYIVKNGQINNQLIDKIATIEGREAGNLARANASRYLRKGEDLTYKSFLSIIAESRIEKMFINAGWSLEAAAVEIGTTEDALNDPENWIGDTFVDPLTGRIHKFTFQDTYQGAIWEEIM